MHLPQIALLGVTAFSASASAEHLRAVFSSGTFSSISGPSGGSLSAQYSGFAILNDAGEAIYTQAYPDDRRPCFSTNGGREFTIEGNCWAQARKFQCKSDLEATSKTARSKDTTTTCSGLPRGRRTRSSSGSPFRRIPLALSSSSRSRRRAMRVALLWARTAILQ